MLSQHRAAGGIVIRGRYCPAGYAVERSLHAGFAGDNRQPGFHQLAVQRTPFSASCWKRHSAGLPSALPAGGKKERAWPTEAVDSSNWHAEPQTSVAGSKTSPRTEFADAVEMSQAPLPASSQRKGIISDNAVNIFQSLFMCHDILVPLPLAR